MTLIAAMMARYVNKGNTRAHYSGELNGWVPLVAAIPAPAPLPAASTAGRCRPARASGGATATRGRARTACCARATRTTSAGRRVRKNPQRRCGDRYQPECAQHGYE